MSVVKVADVGGSPPGASALHFTVIDAPLCAFYAMALRDAADLAQSTGRPEISVSAATASRPGTSDPSR